MPLKDGPREMMMEWIPVERQRVGLVQGGEVVHVQRGRAGRVGRARAERVRPTLRAHPA